jgi:photosystem II stability/assembly factor-like uncharacterized protein
LKLVIKIVILALAFSKTAGAQFFKIIPLDSGKNTSIRGLSVVNSKVAWASGSNGWIAKTINGETFEWQQLKGFEKTDFRDIEAFSENEAIIVSAGSPAYVLKTIDGGVLWKKVYENTNPAIFLDGMDFWNNKEGIIFGDPINGIMQILVSKNRGETWDNISEKANIVLTEGEAGFAASGTSIRTHKNKVYIATGGRKSRLFTSKDKGMNWANEVIPISQGEPSQGCFSIALFGHKIFAVGGDYLKDQLSEANFFYKNIETQAWTKAIKSPFGYKSSIEFFDKKTVISTGTSGIDYSIDNGENWERLSIEGFNVAKKSKSGDLFLIAGSNGRIIKVVKK